MKLSLFITVVLASSAPVTGLFIRRHAKQPKGSTGPISSSAVRRRLKNPKSSANNQEGAECAKRRPDKITFRYEGGTGSISQYQPDKATCKDQDFPMSTTVTVYGQEFTVSSGQEFTVVADGGKFDANTVFSFSSGGVSDCTVHTSCSQPLVIGDKIGPFVLVGGPTGSDCSVDPETCVCCGQVVEGDVTEQEVKGDKEGGHDSPTCVKKRPDKITFKYEGGAGSISQYQPEKATCGDQDFPMSTTVTVYGQEYNVSNGQEFTVFADGGKFDANTVFSFSSGDVSDCTVHTSCSQPLVIGDKIGPFVLVDGPTGSDCSRDPETCICCEPVCTCEARASYENGLVTLDFDYCGEANPEAFDWIGIYPCDAETMVADDAWNDYVYYEDVFNVGFVRDNVYVNEKPLMWSYTCGSPGESICQQEKDTTQWPSKGTVVINPAHSESAWWAFPKATTLEPGCYKAHMERETKISSPPNPIVCKDWAEANEFFVN